MKPALFSAKSEGACPNSDRADVIYTDLAKWSFSGEDLHE